jgi:xylulokinase
MGSDGYLLGFDVGSSSIKAALLDAGTGEIAGSATSPKEELAIQAPHPGWAEQDPRVWWDNIVSAAAELKAGAPAAFEAVRGIGISYQIDRKSVV